MEFSTKEAVKKALALNESSLLSRTLKVQQVLCNHLYSVKFCSANTQFLLWYPQKIMLLESSILVDHLLFVFLVLFLCFSFSLVSLAFFYLVLLLAL